MEFESLALPNNGHIDQHSQVHPLETAARKQRVKADIYKKLQPNQVILTNLPIESEIIANKNCVENFLRQQVNKDLIIEEIKFIKAITISSQPERNAYILVTLGSKRQAHLVQKSLRNIWISDSLLKVRLEEDANKEKFDNRTVIIQNIPKNFNQRNILETFTGQNSGAVVGIELPQERIKVAERLNELNVVDSTSNQEQKKIVSYKQAQEAVEASLNLDKQYQLTLSNQLGKEKMEKIIGLSSETESSQLIADEKLNASIRMLTRLQAEGVQIGQSKLQLLEIQNKISNAPASINQQQAFEAFDIKEVNKQQVEKIMKYLKDNSESAPQVVNEPLDKILQLSSQELANAFDSLMLALDQREELIEKRIQDQLKHFGSTERILVERKNFDLELEDIEDPQRSLFYFKPEQLISVKDQINQVIQSKNLSPEEKFTRLLKGALNPFQDKNFSDQSLRLVDNPDLDDAKKIEAIDPRLPRSVLRLMREGADFKFEQKKMLKDMIEKLRNSSDIPFDELYHQERQLVQAVIEAEKALKLKQESLKSPLANQFVSQGDFEQITAGSLLSDISVYEASKQRIKAGLNKTAFSENSDTSSQYKFQQGSEYELLSQLESGIISKSDYEKQVQLARENEIRNLGYCFITFSHADEARLVLLQNRETFYQGEKIKFDLKANVDHSHLDFDFFVNKAKNDSKLVNEIQKLRQAKQELREFENQLDQRLPKSLKLKNFRQFAKNLIENEDGFIRSEEASIRDADQEERLRSKMKELQEKYPHIDLTQLFDSERAENARKALHKKAFASYKAYEFLKNGIQSNQQTVLSPEESEAKRRLRENDPYNFPELDQTVAVVLNKDLIQPKFNDHGEVIQKPGRRFNGYSEQEFIEAFYGKDLLRQSVLDYKEDPLFKTQRSLKERYPLESFLKTPELEEKFKKLKALGLEPSLSQIKGNDVFPGDPDIAQMLAKHKNLMKSGAYLKDRPHPTDKDRTLLTDLESTFEKYEAAREKRGLGETIDLSEITMIRQRLSEEYKLGEKDWFQIVKQGKYRYEEVEEATEEGTPSIDETKSAKFEQSYDSQKRSEGKFSKRQRTSNQDEKPTGEENLSQENELNDDQLKFDESDLLDKDTQHKTNTYDSVYRTGSWTKNLKYGDRSIKQNLKQKQPINLSQFANLESAERNVEQDVYEKYQQSLTQQYHANFKVDKEENAPQTPRFEDYFNSQQQNLHPFDKITNQVNQDLDLDKQNSIEVDDQILYQRELLGRLMGEKLTPRQFELIAGIHKSTDVKTQRVLDIQQEQFLERREIIRLQQETAEKYRRQKVISGEWQEEQSHDLLKQEVQNVVSQQLGPNQKRMFDRDFASVIETVKLMDSPERLFEKEYYFDERLGQSLDQHTEELKQKYPGMQVYTRRDRDGFAIVKTTFKPEYKYDLEKIENWDRDEARQSMLDKTEKVLKSLFPEIGTDEMLEMLPQNLENAVQQMISNGEQQYELDAWTKLQLQELVNSQSSMDSQQIVAKLIEITENASYDQTKPITLSSQIFKQNEEKPTFDILFEDRERFRAEIYEQLTKRAKKYLFSTKRQETDFVAPRVSDQEGFSRQVLSHENSVQNLEQQVSKLESSQNFDRAAFDKLKAEIGERKKAKERLLSQGLPEFKAYLRF